MKIISILDEIGHVCILLDKMRLDKTGLDEMDINCLIHELLYLQQVLVTFFIFDR